MATHPLDHNLIASVHYKGAQSEYLAAAYYLSRGIQVYWPACQQGVVDFVADVDGALTRVQVKTATWSKTGPYQYLQCRTRLTNKYQDVHPADLYDVMFVVFENRQWVIPAKLLDSSNLSLDGTCPEYKRTQWADYETTGEP